MLEVAWVGSSEPAQVSSLVNRSNCQELLQALRYPESARGKPACNQMHYGLSSTCTDTEEHRSYRHKVKCSGLTSVWTTSMHSPPLHTSAGLDNVTILLFFWPLVLNSQQHWQSNMLHLLREPRANFPRPDPARRQVVETNTMLQMTSKVINYMLNAKHLEFADLFT